MDAITPDSRVFGPQHPVRPVELLRRLHDPSPPVAGLIVDLCGVLYDDSTWPRWLFKLVQHLGLHTTYTPFFRVWRREYLERVKRREVDYWQAWRLFLRAAGLTSGQVDEVEAASHARVRCEEAELLPLPGVSNVLARLKDMGIPLTLLSSSWLGTPDVYHRLTTLGLESYFDVVLSGADLWHDYPDQSPIKIAVQATALPAERLGFVGRDAAVLSEAGAAGLQRIAVNYDDDALADLFLESIDELLAAVTWDTAKSKA